MPSDGPSDACNPRAIAHARPRTSSRCQTSGCRHPAQCAGSRHPSSCVGYSPIISGSMRPTAMTLPAGSVNHAMSGPPSKSRAMPFSSVP